MEALAESGVAIGETLPAVGEQATLVESQLIFPSRENRAETATPTLRGTA